MFDVLCKTQLTKINETFYPENLKAGILYDENGWALDKVLFVENDGIGKDVFNDTIYSLSENSANYIGDVVSLDKLFIEYLGEGPYTLVQMYAGYKMFLNDSAFLNRHLTDFGMFVRDVGYKYKTEIARDPESIDYEMQELFLGLMRIINYKSLNLKRNNEYEIPNVAKGK